MLTFLGIDEASLFLNTERASKRIFWKCIDMLLPKFCNLAQKLQILTKFLTK